jgi:hypothetical protein
MQFTYERSSSFINMKVNIKEKRQFSVVTCTIPVPCVLHFSTMSNSFKFIEYMNFRCVWRFIGLSFTSDYNFKYKINKITLKTKVFGFWGKNIYVISKNKGCKISSFYPKTIEQLECIIIGFFIPIPTIVSTFLIHICSKC